jgi:hypothetical protein
MGEPDAIRRAWRSLREPRGFPVARLPQLDRPPTGGEAGVSPLANYSVPSPPTGRVVGEEVSSWQVVALGGQSGSKSAISLR